jgi:hypothetical protein
LGERGREIERERRTERERLRERDIEREGYRYREVEVLKEREILERKERNKDGQMKVARVEWKEKEKDISKKGVKKERQ